MLNFLGQNTRNCDGVSRRTFLKVGSLAVGGLTLPGLLRQRRRRPRAHRRRADRSSCCGWPGGRATSTCTTSSRTPRPSSAASSSRSPPTCPASRSASTCRCQATHHGQAGHRALGLPHQRRPRHGLAVDADRLSADHRGQRQHLSRDAAPWWRGCAAPTSRGCRPTSTCRASLSLGKAAYLGASYNPFAPDSDPQLRRLPGAQPEAARHHRRRAASAAAASCSASWTRSAATWTRAATSRGWTRFYREGLRDGDRHQGRSGPSTSSASRPGCATAMAATTWASAACWPGGWSRRASPT